MTMGFSSDVPLLPGTDGSLRYAIVGDGMVGFCLIEIPSVGVGAMRSVDPPAAPNGVPPATAVVRLVAW